VCDGLFLLVKEAGDLAAALRRIQHEPRFDLRTAKAVGDGFGAAIDQEIAKSFIPAPEIERGYSFWIEQASRALSRSGTARASNSCEYRSKLPPTERRRSRSVNYSL
jgi:hypothetical protein